VCHLEWWYTFNSYHPIRAVGVPRATWYGRWYSLKGRSRYTQLGLDGEMRAVLSAVAAAGRSVLEWLELPLTQHPTEPTGLPLDRVGQQYSPAAAAPFCISLYQSWYEHGIPTSSSGSSPLWAFG
jgi:hypothetical protein